MRSKKQIQLAKEGYVLIRSDYIKHNIKVSSYIAQYPVLSSSAFKIYSPGRSVQSNTVSTSLGSIQPYAEINARRQLVHISTTVLIYTAE